MKRLVLAVVIVLVVSGCGISRATSSSTRGAGESVVVPSPRHRWSDEGVQGMFLALRARGLRVSFAWLDGTKSMSDSCFRLAIGLDHVRPAPGTRVKRGDTVTLFGVWVPEAIPSLVGPAGPKHYRMPNFIGRPASAAIDWTNQRGMCWLIRHVPSVSSSAARDFYSAYRITAQDPAPGSVVQVPGVYNPVSLGLTLKPRR
jgi:hypothetical protein